MIVYPWNNGFWFAAGVYARFPREIRDKIYNHILDDDTMNLIADRGTTKVNFYPEYSGILHPNIHELPFIVPGLVPRIFVFEIIAAFFAKYKGISVSGTDKIARFLQDDLYHIGVTAANVALSAFEVNIHPFDQDGGERELDPNYVKNNFWPLLSPRQKWAKGSELKIVIWMRTRHFNSIWNIENTYAALQALKAVMSTAKLRGVKVKVELAATVRGRIDVTNHVDDTEKQWESFMTTTEVSEAVGGFRL